MSLAKGKALDPSAVGILQCLKVLAAEAESLSLGHTLTAISRAVRTLSLELGAAGDNQSDASSIPPLTLH